jgi:hypothetical protein
VYELTLIIPEAVQKAILTLGVIMYYAPITVSCSLHDLFSANYDPVSK